MLSKIRRRFKLPRSLKFTRFGTATTLMTLGIGLAAMNTGNNLLYMVFGMMLGAITASGVLSEISLRHLDVDWILPQENYTGESATFRLLVKNRKKNLPSIGVTLEASGGPEESPKDDWIRAHFLHIPANSQKTADRSFVPSRRGRWILRELRIETSFPFGLFRKYLTQPIGHQILVYPRITLLSLSRFTRSGIKKEWSFPQRGTGESFWGMKEFAEGDNPRLISWKSSAKTSRLMVRETERESDREIWLSMEPLREWRKLEGEELESAVSFAASLVWNLDRQGYVVGWIGPALLLSPSPGRNTLRPILSELALFDPKKDRRKRGGSHGLDPRPLDFARDRLRGDNKKNEIKRIPTSSVNIIDLWKNCEDAS